MAKHVRRPGLDRAKVEAALKEAAWLSIHGTREDKDGIFRGPQLVLPNMERVKKRLTSAAKAAEAHRNEEQSLAEPPQTPYRSDEK